jgi:alkylation response protein AidB-like acyl-CoA dehydrogenase
VTIGLSEDGRMALDAADRILREQCGKELVDAAEAGEWPAELWTMLEDAGLPRACAPGRIGGAELPLGEGLSLLRLVGQYAVPVPLAETMIATLLLGEAGAESVPDGPLALALAGSGLAVRKDGEDRLLTGRLQRIAFAPRATRILLVLPEASGASLVVLDPAGQLDEVGVNLAGEPLADLVLDELRIAPAQCLASERDEASIHALLALGRALMISGAMASILDLGTSYALERNQFGRAIARFQAVQQQLAVLAGEAAAAIRAADAALEALGTADERVEIAVAKARAGEAAGRGAEIAHQVHGAMGFTHEHRLHHRTRRLWAWRDEYGHEAYWQAWLGRRIAGVGADGLWGFVSGRA